MAEKYEPTGEQRQFVYTMTMYGISEEKIWSILKISDKTGRKAFAKELEDGVIKPNIDVARTALSMAKSGRHPSVTMFWLRTRGGKVWQGGPTAEELADKPTAQPKLGKKEQQAVDALNAADGTDWGDELNVVPFKAR